MSQYFRITPEAGIKNAPEASSVVAKQTDDFKLRRELLQGTKRPPEFLRSVLDRG